MVRLVFRPYTQFLQSICTSELLRTSTRVSSGFVLTRHSSPSFGSQRMRSQVLAGVNGIRSSPCGPPPLPTMPEWQVLGLRPASQPNGQPSTPQQPKPPPRKTAVAGAPTRQGWASSCRNSRPPRPPRPEQPAGDRPAQVCAHFHFASRFRKPLDSRICWTPWSVFQDGSGG